MKQKSHKAMGRFLLKAYFPELPGHCAKLYLLGCIQPDGNPATYLKGSIRSHWFRGHNFSNAAPFLFRLAKRLEEKERYSLWDYYSLGKLTHYLLDAFTYAHNDHFGKNIRSHRAYEIKLQGYFLKRLQLHPAEEMNLPGTAAEIIRKLHDQYLLSPGSRERDTEFALTACCAVMEKLARPI